MQVAEAFGCEVPFRRPAELAADETPGLDPVLHALGQVTNFDYVVLLQPTSPLRTAADIDGAVRNCVAGGAPSCASVVEVAKPLQWMYTFDASGCLAPVIESATLPTRRQDTAPVYALNGAVYVAQVESLQESRRLVGPETVGYVMPPARSADIDTELDLLWCRFLLDQGDFGTGGARI
jgi:N-acylneuraminate cytidylyltransferase